MSHARRLLIISAPAKNAAAAPGRTRDPRAWRGHGRSSTPARAGALTLSALLLAGCQHWCKPEQVTVQVPVEVEVERLVHVPIDERLTTQHHVATGPVSECLAVAAARGTELRKCNADKAAIRAVQGGPARAQDEGHEQ